MTVTAAEYRKARANGTLHMLGAKPLKLLETSKRAQPERELQRAIAKYLDSLPGCGEDFRWFHVPNERRDAREAMRLAGEGVKAGVPDIVIVLNHIDSLASGIPENDVLWIEVKAPGGSLSPAQREWRDKLQELGHEWHLVRSVEEVRAIMEGR